MVATGWFYLITTIIAGFAIGIGVVLPALAQTHAASRALGAIARQPDEAPVISRNLYIGLAMIESQALYVLIVALILLFANPLESKVHDAAASGTAAMWFLIGSAVVAALTITVGTMASSLGQGRVTGTALESIAEQPAARDPISTSLFISLALLESLALYALIVALILLFANPLVGSVFPG
ncbi:MAG: ATP synthase F0 subunit C [Candidatus Binatia bacterium]